MRPEPGWRSLPLGRLLTAAALVVLMGIGSALMWVIAPFGLIYLASQMQSGTSPSLQPYLVVLFGLAVEALALSQALMALDRAFSRVTGYDPNRHPVPLPWLKSMRGERGSGRKRTVLDVVMVISVALAGVAFAIWFFGFAHPGVPQS